MRSSEEDVNCGRRILTSAHSIGLERKRTPGETPKTI
jgi:hypothetical protein